MTSHAISGGKPHQRPTPWYQQLFPRLTRVVRWLARPGVERPVHREPRVSTSPGRVIPFPISNVMHIPAMDGYAAKTVVMNAPDLDAIEVNRDGTRPQRPPYFTGNPVAEIEAPPSAVGDETRYDLPVIDGVVYHERQGELVQEFWRANPEYAKLFVECAKEIEV